MKRRVSFGDTVLEYALALGYDGHKVEVTKLEKGVRESADALLCCEKAQAEAVFEKLWRGAVTPVSLREVVEELDTEWVL